MSKGKKINEMGQIRKFERKGPVKREVLAKIRIG
jgi:hypothetical protein